MEERKATRTHVAFIKGELVDLCVPSQASIAAGWTDWFNDANTTRFLGQGVFPNHISQQEEFLESLADEGKRMSLMVCDTTGEELWGTISLSMIDWVSRSAQIAMVLSAVGGRPRLAALEAMARMTEHAFLTMGLERVYAVQAYPGLAKWNHRLDVLGYRTEGILRRGFAKGRVISDSLMISVLYEDYDRIRQRGSYWPGEEQIAAKLQKLPYPSLAERLATAIRREQNAYSAELERTWQSLDDKQ